MTMHTEQTVGEVAAQSMAAARVFEDHGIDFCCGGAKPLAVACQEKHLDPTAVLGEIADRAARESTLKDAADWNTAPLADLIDHIVSRHHAYLRDELPRLAAWTAAVRHAHGERDGAMLDRLDEVFTALKQEMEMHMRKEEMILFPAIVRGEDWVAQPIAVMEHEHDSAGQALAELRRLTGGFAPPPHACRTYRALYQGFAVLEKDLHVHIHLENNILFPRALDRGR